jgi:hypothetical protein
VACGPGDIVEASLNLSDRFRLDGRPPLTAKVVNTERDIAAATALEKICSGTLDITLRIWKFVFLIGVFVVAVADLIPGGRIHKTLSLTEAMT